MSSRIEGANGPEKETNPGLKSSIKAGWRAIEGFENLLFK
jgi:hypothetical protein